MLVGYARTSTTDQKAGFEAQLAELAKTGVERVFSEQVSAVGQRLFLEEAFDFCRDGDIFVVTTLDRVARSVMDLAQKWTSYSGRTYLCEIFEFEPSGTHSRASLVLHKATVRFTPEIRPVKRLEQWSPKIRLGPGKPSARNE